MASILWRPGISTLDERLKRLLFCSRLAAIYVCEIAGPTKFAAKFVAKIKQLLLYTLVVVHIVDGMLLIANTGGGGGMLRIVN